MEKIENKVPFVSIVVPVFSEESNIEPFLSAINDTLSHLAVKYEVIFVDDGSNDSTWEIISKSAQSNQKIRGVRFSRNFGKESAIQAGLELSHGDAVVTIDGDLQHPPEVLPLMLELWKTNQADIVDVVKSKREKETIIKKSVVNNFYWLFKNLSGLDINNGTDYKLLDRKVVDTLLEMGEINRFYRGLTHWVGYKHATIDISIAERLRGKSKWSAVNLLLYGLNSVINFSTRPLLFIGIMGVLFLIMAVIIATISLVRILTNTSLGGFPTVIFLQLLIGGIIIASICLLGIYIGKISDEVKHRPMYIIKDEVNQKQDN